MKTYRVYVLDKGAHISAPPIILECTNDKDAIAEARQMVNGQDIELWERDRRVAYFPKKD